VTIIAGSLVAEAGPARFPGPTSRLQSPDGHYVLLNRDDDVGWSHDGSNDNHALFLLNTMSGKERLVRTYPRQVEAIWSKDAQWLAITDFTGSDSSTCFVYNPSNGQWVDVRSAIEKELAPSGLLQNHHVYFKAVAWKKPGLLKLVVEGYGEKSPRGFRRTCFYQVPGKNPPTLQDR